MKKYGGSKQTHKSYGTIFTKIVSMPAEAAKERNIITDKVVLAQTGKTMVEWFEILDEKGARKLDHKGIFYLIAGTEGLKPLGEWNQNLLTTSYEWDRGLKERGQKPGGFEISVSKNVTVRVEMLYQALVDDNLRRRWLPGENVTFRKTTPNKSARITWSDNATSVSVDLYSKGANKSQIVVQRQKIPESEMAAKMKIYWAAALEKLRSILE